MLTQCLTYGEIMNSFYHLRERKKNLKNSLNGDVRESNPPDPLLEKFT